MELPIDNRRYGQGMANNVRRYTAIDNRRYMGVTG